MKQLKKATQIFITICLFAIVQACDPSPSSSSEKTTSSPEKIKDEQLSGFLIGGIYFINGYGGVDAVNKMMSDAGYTSNKDLVSGYKEIMEFPFHSDQASGVKSVFKNMWDITDKASLLATLEDLKTREHQFKAWDYARIVNNACMGYAAGWLTKEEVLNINKELLPMVRKEYQNWDDYFADFNKGRLDWDAEDPEAKAFETLAATITKGEKSIYNILPLNEKTEEQAP